MKTSIVSAIIYLSVGSAALGAAATGIYLLSNRPNAPVTGRISPSVQTSLPKRENTLNSASKLEQMEPAMVAYSAGKLIAPAGDNALEYYLAALKHNPKDLSAQEAIMELVPVAMTALESAMAANAASEVERLLTLLGRADPGAARVTALKQRWHTSVENVENIARQANIQMPASALENVSAQPTTLTQQTNAPEIAATPPITALAAPTVAPKVLPSPTVAANAKANESIQASPNAANPAVENRVVEARALSTARAVFPAQARRQKIEGWVDIQVDVDASGRVTAALVVGAQPSRIFDVEARRAAMRWRYSPKLVNDEPVSSVLRQRIKFSLSG